MKEGIFVYLVGTAGSGKSTLTKLFQQWFTVHGLDAITVNLDPGAENLPYKPDVDIRDWIKLQEVMEAHDLGPNGAQIVCADMLALNTDDVKKAIYSFKSDYVMVDTPGQLELFVFREAGKYIVEFLNPEKSTICYLLDPGLARSPSGFVTQLLLSLTTNFRLNKPQINVLSKADLLSEEDLDAIMKWTQSQDELYNAVICEKASMYRDINEAICHLLSEFGGVTQLIPVSKQDSLGIEDVYTVIQHQFLGGEDLLKD